MDLAPSVFKGRHELRVEVLGPARKRAGGGGSLPPLTSPRTGLWVPKMWSCTLTRPDALASWGPMSRVLYWLLVSLARLAVRSGRSKDGKLYRWLRLRAA